MDRLVRERLSPWKVSVLFLSSGGSYPTALHIYLVLLRRLKEILGMLSEKGNGHNGKLKDFVYYQIFHQ